MKAFKTIAFLVCWIGQLAFEFWLGKQVWALDMLPFRMFFTGVIVFFLLWILEALLVIYARRKNTDPKTGRICKTVSVLLILLTLFACVVGVQASQKLSRTIDSVTEPKVATTSFAVYVRRNDRAKTLVDAENYDFGVSTAFDTENTRKAIQMLNECFDRELQTTDFDTVQKMVDALLAEETDAILLNMAYVPILAETVGYEDFGEQTRVLYELSVEMVKQPASSDRQANAGGALVGKNLHPVADITTDPFVVYLSGSDTRSASLVTGNSDVNILVVVNPQSKNILLLNTPRDYYIPNPAGKGALDKLTHCGVYGISCSIDALSDLYDETVQYYAQINFKGFEMLIDSIGGITVESDYDFTTLNGKFHIIKGPNVLNGTQALGFVRERYSFSTGDNQRGINQMKVLTAVIESLSTGKVIRHYSTLLNGLRGMFITNISSKEISDLVKMQLGDGADWNVQSFAVTGNTGMEYTFSIPNARASVMYPDESLIQKASELVNRVIAGDTIQEEDIQTK